MHVSGPAASSAKSFRKRELTASGPEVFLVLMVRRCATVSLDIMGMSSEEVGNLGWLPLRLFGCHFPTEVGQQEVGFFFTFYQPVADSGFKGQNPILGGGALPVLH